jgi:hypothetical protein
MGIIWQKECVTRLRFVARDERGSLSILILSLFMTILLTLIILSDISSIYFAKRSLTQVTEAAAQRGVRNLDMDAYYRGKYNANQLFINLTGQAERDTGIPIDCEKGRVDALSAIQDFSRNREQSLGHQLGEIRVDSISCDGFQLSIRTSSVARLPFLLPFVDIDKVEISSEVGTFDERKVSTNYYGINLG